MVQLFVCWMSLAAVAGSHRLEDLQPYVLEHQSHVGLCDILLNDVLSPLPEERIDQIIGNSGLWTVGGRNIIKYVAGYPLDLEQIELIAMWEQLARALIEMHPENWHVARFLGSDGSIIYIGEYQNCLVFKSDGSIYKGIIPELPRGDIWKATYLDLEMIRPPHK